MELKRRPAMDINENTESPFEIKVSFNKFIDAYESLMDSKNQTIANNAKVIVGLGEQFPVLKEGFTDLSILETHKEHIDALMQDIFNPVLTNNEIKTAQVPFYNRVFKSTERFKSILSNVGPDFELQVKNMPFDQWYIIASSIILKACYGLDLNFKRPFFYEIPDVHGIMRYYKILYNADFIEVKPKAHAPKITEDDFNELLDNFGNIDLWKEKFPPNSYEFNGFILSNMFDVTDDQSISNIKTTLIGDDKRKDEGFMDDFEEIFRSLFGLKNIKVGFSIYNEAENAFEVVYGHGMTSYLLNNLEAKSCTDALCQWSYNRLLNEKHYFTVSDVDQAFEASQGKAPHIVSLHEQGIKSAIFAPIANDEGLMGILEIVSQKPKLLNSINANKLVDVMPFIVSAVERSKNEEKNLIEAIIQQECTSIHPSVYWRFEQEAREYIKNQYNGEQANFNSIIFENIYPLYGQIDIKGSSSARNRATQKDLSLQLNAIKSIIEVAAEKDLLPIYSQYLYQINEYLENLESNFQVDSEHQISSFIHQEIEPVLDHLGKRSEFNNKVELYYNSLDDKVKTLYKFRKDYDESIALINKNMASLLDEKQVVAQQMYPHYFERFKTDGVEHNMYIGESLTKENNFNPIYLYNLRLWQLQVMCEMENSYYQMQSEFPVKLDVASMILVFNQPLSISFRMDEKLFDVDGTYNARYEIVKKRVDKAFIKGTEERVTQKGKITIIYSQKEDENEYLQYIKFLQSKHYLDTDVEILELQDLQAVTGLKAIRVSVLYHKDKNDKAFYTYDDLMKEINA